MQKLCPTCFEMFPMDQENCPTDGTPLVIPVDRDLTGKVVKDKYKVTHLIGEGGMGYVYRASHLRLQRNVALKVLRSEIVQDGTIVKRFLNEARASASLKSPHTITLHDFGVTKDGLLYYEMELLEGKPLSDVLKEEGPLDPPRAAAFILQACESLEEAHSRGILHRDIKPDNLFVVTSGRREMIKVLDFGIAKMLNQAPMDTRLTGAGMIVGTPQYLSPEQATGDEVDATSDLYSLATVLYELLVGKPPFDEKTPVMTMAAHVKAPLPPLSQWKLDLPRETELDGFLRRALSKKPAGRYPNVDEFRQALIAAAALDEYTPGGTGSFSAWSGVRDTTQQWGKKEVEKAMDDMEAGHKLLEEQATKQPQTTAVETPESAKRKTTIDPGGPAGIKPTPQPVNQTVETVVAETSPELEADLVHKAAGDLQRTSSPTEELPAVEDDNPVPSRRGWFLLLGSLAVLGAALVVWFAMFYKGDSNSEVAKSPPVSSQSDIQKKEMPALDAGALNKSLVDVVQVEPADAQAEPAPDLTIEAKTDTQAARPASPDSSSQVSGRTPDIVADTTESADLAREMVVPTADAESGPSDDEERKDQEAERRRFREARERERQKKEEKRKRALAEKKKAEEAGKLAAEKKRKQEKARKKRAENAIANARQFHSNAKYGKCIDTLKSVSDLASDYPEIQKLKRQCAKRKAEEDSFLEKIDDSKVLDNL